MFFTLLIATLDFTASVYCHTCHRHSLHSFTLQQSSPAIIWARLALFYWYSYTHRHQPHYHVTANIAVALYTSQTHQSCRTITPTLVTLTWLAFSHHHSLVHFACLSARIAEPLGLSHCGRFGHIAVTLIALPSVFGFCCCALHWLGDCRISATSITYTAAIVGFQDGNEDSSLVHFFFTFLYFIYLFLLQVTTFTGTILTINSDRNSTSNGTSTGSNSGSISSSNNSTSTSTSTWQQSQNGGLKTQMCLESFGTFFFFFYSFC